MDVIYTHQRYLAGSLRPFAIYDRSCMRVGRRLLLWFMLPIGCDSLLYRNCGTFGLLCITCFQIFVADRGLPIRWKGFVKVVDFKP